MGKEQKEGSLRGRQENVASGAQLGQPAESGLPIEVCAVPRVEPIEIFPGQPPQQDEIPALRRTAKMRAVEATHGLPGESIGNILRGLYHGEGKTQVEVASVLRVSVRTVQMWMTASRVESRTRSSRKGEKRVGPKERQVAEVVGSLRDFLYTQREEKGASMAAITEEIEHMSGGRVTVSLDTVKRWLRKLGIKSMRAKPKGLAGSHLPEATKQKMAEKVGRSATKTIVLMQYAGVGIRQEDKPGKRKKVSGRVKREDREVFEQASKAGLTSKLPEKWRYILADRYLTRKPPSLEEVGKEFDLSRERVRQIEQKALRALRYMLSGKTPSYARDRRRLSQPERFRIDVLGLSTYARNALARAKLADNLRKLDAMSDEELLRRVRMFGQKSLRELREALERSRQNLG